MKKLILTLMAFAMLFTGQAFAEDIGAKVESGMKKYFKENEIPLDIKIQVISKVKEPKGLYFIQMTLSDPASGRSQEQFVFSDGKYIMPDILTIDGNTSLKDILTFNASEKVEMDLSKLTLMEGNKDAKHVIVKVSDFQCPYCRKAYEYLHSEIERRNLDVAVYMMHLPLSFHPKAQIYAQIFEAGKEVGADFGDDLYRTNKEFDAKPDEEIIEHFAKMTKDAAKFKALVKSPSVAGKIKMQADMAADLGITGTPELFFDGKPVGGFKQSMYNLALDSFK
ncbi:DSBA oxidoreductase [Denitrovibrio acetiphilus DSM 12809]|uniref:DSBA oxidoreductase n=1 Tax=Denitrovibrio acetiphilus (strain DSM 12809 / NBRC 114555 / N2460) TaxID=522772 RepID=D4H0M0_DENA2|nr:thioredoxin domain-containing protein [Denitrovibrio acetiphilus]ADD68533.1 DSBA oxidoreductase [Denitrovibrio acetiphilus DSM 12809]